MYDQPGLAEDKHRGAAEEDDANPSRALDFDARAAHKDDEPMSHPWPAGTLVDRDIDGMWFPARILKAKSRSYDVEYLDDGNTEQGVGWDELRLANGARDDKLAPAAPLKLPLENLILGGLGKDDPAEVKTPRAIVHNTPRTRGPFENDEAEANAFVVNGDNSQIALGGGVRGIRFLRSSARA